MALHGGTRRRAAGGAKGARRGGPVGAASAAGPSTPAGRSPNPRGLREAPISVGGFDAGRDQNAVGARKYQGLAEINRQPLRMHSIIF